MGNIPQDEIDRVKSQISMRGLAESDGVAFKRHGDNWIGLCPFHDDKEPSFVVSEHKQVWNCLGQCGKGGDQYAYVMNRDGVGFREAHQRLAAQLPPHARKHVREAAAAQPRPSARLMDGENQKLLRRVVDYYAETLKDNKRAQAYLMSRGIQHEEALSEFRIGYGNRTLSQSLPSPQSDEGREIRQRLLDLGIFLKSGHEHFNGFLSFPIVDANGEVTEIYGRRVGQKSRETSLTHKYLPGPHHGIWNPKCLISKTIILCESIIDALTMWVHGLRHVTASFGVNGFTDEMFEAFKQHQIQSVLIAYDADEAGERAACRLAAKLQPAGIACFRVRFPAGVDANEYALANPPAEESLAAAIRKASWMGDQPEPPGLRDAFRFSCRPSAALEPVASELPSASGPPVTAPHPSGAAKPKTTGLEAQVNNGEVLFSVGSRQYRVRGWKQNGGPGRMKINVLAQCEDAFHMDTLDLCSDRQRLTFIHRAAVELAVTQEIVRSDLGQILFKLEEMQEEQEAEPSKSRDPVIDMSEKDQQEAMALLQDPRLTDRILSDFDACGLVGEEINKLAGYIAAVSRNLRYPLPLAIIIQSLSAAGKTATMEAILSFMPKEQIVKYSAMTGQSLFYMCETNLKHKILAIVEEEGAERASYPLKLLQSDGELTIASTGKDPKTGKMETREYHVEGPVMIMLTTTAVEIDEELQNRCLILTVDESREQTRAIHRIQRRAQTLDGLFARKQDSTLRRAHQNAQRLLKPLDIVNPFADDLTFQDAKTRMRRDHMKYLTLISSIALLHQYQRPVKQSRREGKEVQFIEVTLDDIELANHIANQILGRTLDELPPQTRRLLRLIDTMVKEVCEREGVQRSDYWFTRRDVREYTQWGNTQLMVHMKRLEEFEYLLAHRGKRGQCFVYECLYNGEGQTGEPFFMGLVDVERLRKGKA